MNIFEFKAKGRGHETVVVSIRRLHFSDDTTRHELYKSSSNTSGYCSGNDELDAFMLLQKWIEDDAPLDRLWRVDGVSRDV